MPTQTASSSPEKSSRAKKILLTLIALIVILLIGISTTAYWAYRQQTSLLISSANQFLQTYGIEVLNIDGLQTGLQQSRADAVDFRIQGHSAVQRIHALTLSYELSTLIQGQFSELSAESVVLQLQHTALANDAQIEINNVSVSCQALTRCSASAAINASVKQVNMAEAGLGMTDITGSSVVTLDYNAADVSMQIAPGLELNLALININNAGSNLLDIEQLSLKSNQTWRLNLNSDNKLLVFDGGQLQVNAPSLRNQPGTDNAGLSGFESTVSRFNGSYNYANLDTASHWTNGLSAQTRVEIANIYTTLQPYNLWSYRWPIDLRWDTNQTLSVDVTALLGDRDIARVQLTQNFNDGLGNLQFNTESLVFSPTTGSLSNLVSPLPFESDLLEGELDIAANIRWQKPAVAGTAMTADLTRWQPGGSITISTKELAGFVDETIFAGLNTSAQWQLQNDLSVVSSAPTLLQIQQLDPGLPLSNITTLFHLDTASGLLELSALNFDMFGGAAQADAITINLKQTEAVAEFGNSFELRLDAIDISQVLSLSAYDSVTASGLVDGNLPVRLRGLTPIVEGGRLSARAPGGSIRYNHGAGASGNQSLDLVYQALQHYRYETLSANVDYNDAGELSLAVQLQGLSPELNNGQRINLNLNISDNIPALLQSLQAAQGITDRLEELLQ